MKWILSHLLPIGIVGTVALLASFLRVSVQKPEIYLFCLGAGSLILVLIGAAYVAFSAPGREETVDEANHPHPQPPLPNTALKRLRLIWDSEAIADWAVAGTLAKISDVAYLPPVNAQECYSRMGFTEFMPVVAGSMIGYVISCEDATVIAFRGTDFNEVSDWLANLGVTPTDTPHGQVHEGFYEAYQSLKPQIVKLLAGRKPKHLWITGHSLGGALALCGAYDLADNEKLEINGIITFGQPMVARKPLSDYLDSSLLGRYAHFVNEADIVPRVPPSYAPCGSLVWFKDGGIQRSKPKHKAFGAAVPRYAEISSEQEITPMSEPEFRELQARLQAQNVGRDRLPDGTLMYRSLPSLIEDHSMSLYLVKVLDLLNDTATL